METIISHQDFSIIIIDDDEDVLNMAQYILEHRQIDCQTFTRGVDAIDYLKDRPLGQACILLDQQLKEETGLDLCRLLRSIPKYRNIPILFLTATYDNDLLVKALKYGANDFIRKPFRIDEVLARIETHVALARQKMKLEELNAQLEKRNEESVIMNTRALMLQEVLKKFTPRSTWEKADLSALEGMIEIPNEEVWLTFLFLDVKAFTGYAANHSASEVIDALNEIFGPASDAIERHAGDIDKYIGDSIFAVFNQERNAVQAALDIRDAIQQANQKRLQAGKTELVVRIGLHCGPAIRGNVGGEHRKENTLIGDAVNITSRIETACRPGAVLISDELFQKVQDIVSSNKRYLLKVRGKDQIIPVRYIERC